MSDIINMNVQFPRIKREEIRLISTVGHGSFGVVHHGFSLAVGHVAIKVCHSDSDQRKLAKEVENTIRVCASHPNIVKLFGTFDCPQNGLSIVFEYMSGGSLHDVILKRTDLVYCVDHIVSWVYQISSAMAHMHKCLIMHRDVKPENILMNELFTTVKLCDLGEARTLHDDHSTLTPGVGTYLFMAPEAMEEGSYTFAVDVYSLGMTIWMMFARRVPSFVKKFESVVAFINAIRNGLRPSKLPMLQIFNEMIAECLKNDPKERATITEVRDFAADLVQKFPFGSNFLVRLPDSQVLQEPINVRGDVQSGEDVATRPSPSKTLLPTPATRKPTPDSATPKARAETPRDVKRRDEDERKRQDERSRFLEEDRQRVECAVMLVEEERSREAERQRKQEYLEKLRAARQRARIEEEERQRQREMERLEVPREHKGRQSVTFDSNVEMHSPMPTCPEADDTFDGNFERITVQDNGEPGAERFELVEPNVTIVDELPHSSSKLPSMMSDMLEMQVQFPVIKREEIRKIRTVGRGTFGVVYHGFSLAVGHVAIKVCHSDSDQRKLAKEVENTIRVSASHPNIVKLFGTFDCPQNGLSIVYEYMSGGSLHDVILKRTDLVYCVDHVVSWIYQISSAMAHMHKCKIVHRDVKPENILMNELFTTVKLCDLGEARVLHDDHSNPTPRVGTYLFMAPEVMLEGKYTFGVDVYSLGITIWMMFARRVPSFVMQFTGNVVDFVNAVRNGRRPSKLPMLEIFNQMVADCLKGDPEERAKITEVRDFAAELVEKFPFGNNFLVRLPDSKVLQEPLNVRGDVRSGEGVATRPSPMETLKPAPRTKKPTTPGSKARLETPREIKDKVDNDERKQQEERDHQRAMIEHINALKAARERARIEEEERQRDMQRQREMERVEQQKVVQSVTFDLNVQAHSPEVEQPTTLDTVDTVDRDLEQITVEDNGHADEGLSLVEPVVNIADVLPQAQETQEEKLKHFYLNSTRIPINVVKDRMKKFEKE